jgi:hypothetical protein
MLTFATLDRTYAEINSNTINPADRRANFQNSRDSLFKSWDGEIGESPMNLWAYPSALGWLIVKEFTLA